MNSENNFTDLILLIGTSPLPNYVVAKYFCQINSNLKKIWFVHSEAIKDQKHTSSRKFAENIKHLLTNTEEKPYKFEFIPLENIEDLRTVQNKLQNAFVLSHEDSVHLNLTGGTKMMAVASFDFIRNNEEIINKSFSYLSSRSFELRDAESKVISEDLRPYIKTTIEDMLLLHNYKRVNSPSQYDFSDATKLFTELIEVGELENFYNENGRGKKFNPEKNGWDRSLFQKNGDLIKKIIQIDDKILNYKPSSNDFLKIIEAMPEDLRIYDRQGNFVKPKEDKKLEEALGYLSGKWIEEYVYQIIKDHNETNFFQIDKNWEIAQPDWKKNKFEIDVILIKGYQLCGISCTTLGSNYKAAIKNKGFEIILRTKQMGGDEAKAVLVTRADENLKEKLQAELNLETGGQKNILVLGKKDLPKNKLLKAIKSFLA